MIQKKMGPHQDYCVYATSDIPKDTLLFSFNEWIEDEKEGWMQLSVREAYELPEEIRSVFLKYGYDRDFGIIVGPFHEMYAKNDSNFMNHSCDPNMIYDFEDNIRAKRDIKAGEELTIDYGNFVVNVNQDFECRCGSVKCRKRILSDDWKFLCKEIGHRFPRFMHKHIDRLQGINESLR